jgi:hypothetical protein
MKIIHLLFILTAIGFLTMSCGSEKSTEPENRSAQAAKLPSPEEIGQEISMAAQKQLGRNLMQAIEEGGYAHAVSYCRVEAKNITDRVGVAKNAEVSRVSDQWRNPNNAASEDEMAYIAYYKQALKDNTDWSPKLIIAEGIHTYYAPILTQPLCLNCHGDTQTDIKAETLTRIQSDYPQDQAVGYGISEVRGMWKIEWQED